jgi:hypothetical protein
MLDVSVSYNRYKFIGHEFLTWLWFAIDNQRCPSAAAGGEPTSVDIGNRLVLENRRREAVETVTIKGDDAGLEEGILALRKGAVVTEMNLAYRRGEQQWHVTLKAESFHMTSLRCPATGAVETKEDLEGAVLEKVFLCDEVIGVCDGLFSTFMNLRLSEEWQQTTVPEIERWIRS